MGSGNWTWQHSQIALDWHNEHFYDGISVNINVSRPCGLAKKSTDHTWWKVPCDDATTATAHIICELLGDVHFHFNIVCHISR